MDGLSLDRPRPKLRSMVRRVQLSFAAYFLFFLLTGGLGIVLAYFLGIEDAVRLVSRYESPDPLPQEPRMFNWRADEAVPPPIAEIFGAEPPWLKDKSANSGQSTESDTEAQSLWVHYLQKGEPLTARPQSALWHGLRHQQADEIVILVASETETGVSYVAHISPLPGNQSLTRQSKLLMAVGLFSLLAALAAAFMAAYLKRHLLLPSSRLLALSKQLGVGIPDPDAVEDFARSDQEFQQIAEQMLHSFAELQSSNARERAFLNNASHELRTPLAVISSSVELAEYRMAMDESPEAQIQKIKRAQSGMQLSVEALMKMARQATPYQFDRKPIDLEQLVAELRSDHRYLLREGVSEDIRIPQGVSILGEPVLARMVLSNVIRNAYENSLEGCISMHAEGMQGKEVLLRIENPLPTSGAINRPQGEQGFGSSIAAEAAARMGWALSSTHQADPDSRRLWLCEIAFQRPDTTDSVESAGVAASASDNTSAIPPQEF